MGCVWTQFNSARPDQRLAFGGLFFAAGFAAHADHAALSDPGVTCQEAEFTKSWFVVFFESGNGTSHPQD